MGGEAGNVESLSDRSPRAAALVVALAWHYLVAAACSTAPTVT